MGFMRNRVVAFLFLALVLSEAGAVDYRNASVEKLQATLPDTNCFYFTLQGVVQADPVAPGAQWFAILRTQAHAADQYALLLSAKVSGAPVWITTSGILVCGYAGVRYVTLE